jgi:hypothetical protein
VAAYLTAVKACPNLDAMANPSIKPNHKAIRSYYEALRAYDRQDVEHETALRTAFQSLLEQLGRQFAWTLIPELADSARNRSSRHTVYGRRQFAFWVACSKTSRLLNYTRLIFCQRFTSDDRTYSETQVVPI